MTPADERIVQLLAKWRKSLDLHTRYTRLSDDQYWLVQPWPQHQRPTPWIVDLASQRLADLQRIVQTRVAAGDPSLSEALELMSFLANLVGSQHVQRYIPTAEVEQQRPIESLTVQDEPPAPPPPVSDATTARNKVLSPASDPHSKPDQPPEEDKASLDSEVVRDAIRLLSWGREWHELPAAIARMSGRPKTAQVRQILKAHRDTIELQATDLSAKH
ncbi:MAG: hypothetical protein E4H19_15825 [Chromatiales bacterium]|nr:MAG: hypothetical protein E4H19_15825 [Chromatiales bacterium]